MTDTEIERFYIILGVRVQAIREERGMTQEGLGQLIGLERTSIANLEAGRQRILAHQVIALCRALRTTPLRLMKGI